MKSEKRLRSVEKIGNDPAISYKDSPRALKVTDILDVTAKLIGALAILGATYVANLYQSSMAASNLLSQREQSDSSLRASMFRDLIGPIVGGEKNNGDIPANRERLLVELLALNFYEHFELKPIMLHVDRRLAADKIKDMDQSQKESSRESLRFIARRVVQRQGSAMLLRDHPLMSRYGIRNWPPVWTWVDGPEIDGPPEHKSPNGEVGVLKWASLTGIQPPDRCYLLINHEGSSYMGCLLFDDSEFCRYLVQLLDSYCNHPIAEIGSIDLTHTL